MWSILFPFLWILGSLKDVSGGAVMEVKFMVFVNPKGKGANGHCCDGKWFVCFGACDHFFKICVDKSNGLNNVETCPYGYKKSGPIENQNSIKFGNSFGGLKNPISFKMNSWPGSVKLKIDVWDSDENVNVHDHVEFLKKVIRQPAGHSALTAKSVTYKLVDRTSLGIKVKVYCEPEYFGQNCETHCVPRNDSTGHYTCDPDDGSHVCHPGWNGTYCNNNYVNECERLDPCNQTHICVDRPSGYICTCPYGKTGEDCNTTGFTCDDNPCMNGGNCSMVNGSIVCSCADGWTGINCDESVKGYEETTQIGNTSPIAVINETEQTTMSQIISTEQEVTADVNMTSLTEAISTDSSTEHQTTTTTAMITTIPPPAFIMLKGRLLGDNEEDVRKGIARIMTELLNMKRNLILKLNYGVFALTNGQIVTKVSIRGTEDGKNIDNGKLQDVLSNTPLEILEQYIPHPIYREFSKSPNAEPLVDEHDSWIHRNWYIVLIGFVVLIALVVLCVALVMRKRRKTVRTGQKDVVARPSSAVNESTPAQSFENSLYFEMNNPQSNKKENTRPKVTYKSMP